jgi:hypothetical protein
MTVRIVPVIMRVYDRCRGHHEAEHGEHYEQGVDEPSHVQNTTARAGLAQARCRPTNARSGDLAWVIEVTNDAAKLPSASAVDGGARGDLALRHLASAREARTRRRKG